MEDAGDLSPTSLACGAPTTLCPVCRAVVRKDHMGPSWIVRELVNALLIRCDYGVSYDFETKNYEHGVGEEGKKRGKGRRKKGGVGKARARANDYFMTTGRIVLGVVSSLL